MKVNSIVNALLLLVGVSCAGAASSSNTPTLGDCKAFCKETRQGMLADIGTCKPALKQPPVPKLFNACVEGRKKAFDQACIPICIKAEMSVSSFEGCKVIAKKNGQKYENWCRKGYDSILQNLESFLVEHSEKSKQDEDKQELEKEPESEPVQKSEPVKSESVQNELESEPVQESEPAQSEPVQSESVVANNDVHVEQQRRAREVRTEESQEEEPAGNQLDPNDASSEVESIDEKVLDSEL
mmetsp:Transcript_28939/g.49935  ORF Transcript_28939/g.49935 Transcript_28939/m.49935 type:complete len:241 (-) Transcript_28939:210-932(-)